MIDLQAAIIQFQGYPNVQNLGFRVSFQGNDEIQFISCFIEGYNSIGSTFTMFY